MKKNLFTALLGLFCTVLFAQKIIENPSYGFATIPGSVTKVELLDSTTVLHFQIKGMAGSGMYIPKMSYIQDLSGEEKLFVLNVTGVKMGENIFPESGELLYQMQFPKLNPDVKSIDFGEANDGGNWFVYNLVINEEENDSLLPKELRGNWMLTNGSNRWDYTFDFEKAIVDSRIWSYKSVDKKGKGYIITLENSGDFKIVYAKLNKNGNVDFGLNPKMLQTYSLEETNNPNFKLKNDEIYEVSDFFKIDSVIYSGVIKGYTKRAGQKTGMISFDNVFKGGEESTLVKISDDGSFSVKLNVIHPQFVYIEIAGINQLVFIEPGKEIFHLIDSGKSFFMGSCAQVNSDLQAMNNIRCFDYNGTMDKVGVTPPEVFKKICFDARDKELEAVKALAEKQFISNKALQIKKIDIEYRTYVRASSYGMYRNGLERRNKSVKEEEKRPFKAFTVDSSFYDFITEETINNKLAVLSRNYNYFMSRLMYDDVFRGDGVVEPTVLELADWAQKEGKKLSVEEVEMVDAAKNLKADVELENEKEFNNVFGNIKEQFYKKYSNGVSELKTDQLYSVIDNNIKTYFNVPDAYLYDVMTFQMVSRRLENYNVYTDNELKSIQQKIKDPFLVKYMAVANDATKAKIELNKTKGGYNVNVVEKSEADELFDGMIKKFKGKVVYVDFWATWCGPCRSGIRKIVPLKEEMKNDDVVFLYITDQTSPEGTWKNTIVDIKGEHYRVSKDEWNYLSSKFEIHGIPHYALVNRKGEVVRPQMGHNSNEKLKSILKEEMEK